MSTKPDPRIGDALERALPDGSPRPSAKARIHAAVLARTEENRRFRQTRAYFAVAAMAAFVVATMAYLRKGDEPSARAPAASSVANAANSASTLVLSSGARVLVQPGSDVVVERDDVRETALRLGHGRMVAAVKRREGKPFVVRSHDVRVDVIGTIFAVETRASGEVAVSVARGQVEVTNAGRAESVATGETWPKDALPFTFRAEELEWAGSAEAAPEQSAEPAPLPEITAPPRAPEIDRAPAVATAMEPRRQIRAQSPEPSRATLSPFADAKQREAAGDLHGALKAYEAVANSPDKDAEDASFAAGRLRTKLGDIDGALDAFRAYRERYPRGAYVRVVGVHVLDLLLKKGDDGAVRDEANRFLGAYPDDPGAWRFRMARASLAIKSGDCAAALRDLAFVPEKEAGALRARCSAPP
jgi:TolA-binding protein